MTNTDFFWAYYIFVTKCSPVKQFVNLCKMVKHADQENSISVSLSCRKIMPVWADTLHKWSALDSLIQSPTQLGQSLCPSLPPLPPQGNSHIRRMLAIYLRGNAVLVPIKVFILKRLTAVAFVLTFRVLSWQKMTAVF